MPFLNASIFILHILQLLYFPFKKSFDLSKDTSKLLKNKSKRRIKRFKETPIVPLRTEKALKLN